MEVGIGKRDVSRYLAMEIRVSRTSSLTYTRVRQLRSITQRPSQTRSGVFSLHAVRCEERIKKYWEGLGGIEKGRKRSHKGEGERKDDILYLQSIRVRLTRGPAFECQTCG